MFIVKHSPHALTNGCDRDLGVEFPNDDSGRAPLVLFLVYGSQVPSKQAVRLQLTANIHEQAARLYLGLCHEQYVFLLLNAEYRPERVRDRHNGRLRATAKCRDDDEFCQRIAKQLDNLRLKGGCWKLQPLVEVDGQEPLEVFRDHFCAQPPIGEQLLEERVEATFLLFFFFFHTTMKV